MAMLVYGSLHTTPPGESGAFNLDGYRAMLSRANGVVRSGEKITVIVRPEVIQLIRGAGARSGKGIAWTGVVRQRFFRGTRNLYTVEVGAHRFSVDAPPDQPFVPGTEVVLTVDATQTWAVRQ